VAYLDTDDDLDDTSE